MFTLSHLVLVLSLLSAAGAETVAYTGATLLPMTGEPAVTDGVLLVEGDRIAALGPADGVEVPEGARVVDCQGTWILPGLVDAHVHFFQSGGLYTRPDIVDLREVRSYEDEQDRIRERLESTFRRQLASGITAVVDVGGPLWNLEVRQQARSSELAPRVAVAGPLISTVSREVLDLGDPPIIRAESPRDARRMVREQVRAGVDLVKVWFIVTPEQGVEASLPVLEAVVRAAHRAGLRVAVHATELASARASVQAGADILVHSVDDAPVDEAFLELLRERGTHYTTTLVVYEGYAEVLGQHVQRSPMEIRFGDPEVMASWGELPFVGPERVDMSALRARDERLTQRAPQMAENLVAVHEAGIPVAAGTDAGNIGTLHGPSLHRELALMAQAGLSPEQVLVAATREAARVFAEEPGFGTLAPGMLADLLVVEADPRQDLAALEQLRWVVLGGRAHAPHDILAPNPEWVVQEQVEAYNARELEAFLDFYAPDAELSGLVSDRTTRGREAMAETYGALFEASPELHCHVTNRTVSGDFVVDHELVTGMRGGPPVRAVAIYEVRDGEIQRVWFLPKE